MTTKLAGILNVTPDSFSDGGLYVRPEVALAHARQLFHDGASLVDVGAESTRPGAITLSATEEWQRLKDILPELLRLYPGKISLDTYHPETAERALGLGNVIINDVTGMHNPAMVEVVARHNARCIVSHLPGSDVQAAHKGELADDMQQVVSDLRARANLLIKKGVTKNHIILDPGIGFGKSPELNRALLKVPELIPDFPVMIGYSRKRFLGEQRMELAPNLAAGRTAVTAGAAYLRVHDVAAHMPIATS